MLSSSASSDASASRNCSRPRNSLFWLRSTSHRTQNTRNLLAEKYLPQIGTDAHRLGGYGILPYPRSQQHPQTSVNSVNSVGEQTQPTICVDLCNPWETIFPQNPRNAQKFLAEKSLPQMHTDAHRLGGYGILPYPRSQQHPKTSVNSVNSVEEQTQPSHLCKSVKSVGGPTQPNSHETCGKIAILSRLVQRRPLHPL